MSFAGSILLRHAVHSTHLKERPMSEHTMPQNQDKTPITDDTELSEQELEGVAGGDTVNNCPNTNCPCVPPADVDN
jgi:hypothetical protein